MLTKKQILRLRQDYPEGVPPWMIQKDYSEKQIRVLMQGRRVVYTPPTANPDAIPPEHRFAVEPEVWDDAVFVAASHYTVAIGRSPFDRQVHSFKTFEGALAFAKVHNESIKQMGNMPRAIVYAVTTSGRSTMLVPKRWEHYEKLAQEKRAETGA